MSSKNGKTGKLDTDDETGDLRFYLAAAQTRSFRRQNNG